MKSIRKWLFALLKGLAAGALALLAADRLIRSLGALIGRFGSSLGLEASGAAQLAQIIGQLENAQIALPFTVVLPAGCLLGLLAGCLFSKKSAVRRVFSLLYWLIALLLLTAAALALCNVNDLMLVTTLRVLLPVIGSMF